MSADFRDCAYSPDPRLVRGRVRRFAFSEERLLDDPAARFVVGVASFVDTGAPFPPCRRGGSDLRRQRPGGGDPPGWRPGWPR
ncbi:hypothetical protein Misp01_12630 [Microtetraspora sp. NBRC 13810]|nr:hypothetical protein Misp01_12630 [Microtetraspora sp. NBRC 13810]